MNSSWRREIGAVFAKELNAELRTKSGLLTAGLFSVVAVIALAYAAYNTRLTGTLASGMIWVAILFADVVSLPRIFLADEEQGTMDLLRLTARPHAVFWGKSLFALGQAVAIGLVLSAMYIGLVGQRITDPILLVLSLFGGSACLAGAVTLSSALVAQAANRSALSAAVAVTLVLPVVVMAIGATRGAMGEGFHQPAVNCAIGLYCYGIATQSVGPGIFALIWRC